MAPAFLERKNETKNISTKYTHKGMAIRTTSKGSWTMYSPLRENITTMVNSRAMRVSGLILGMNFFSYQSRPLTFRPMMRERTPGDEGNSQINKDAFRNLTDADIHHGTF